MDRQLASQLESLLVNQTCGAYTVGNLINYGFTAAVFRAYDKDNKAVALKIYDNNLTAHLGSIAERFAHQEQISRLQIPNIVSFIASGTVCIRGISYCYMAMEYVAGRNLKEYMQTERINNKFICQVKDTLLQVSNRLLHEGFAHRDIKPENIMITSTGNIMLVDLDLVRCLHSSENEDIIVNTIEGICRHRDADIYSRQGTSEGCRYINLVQIQKVLYYLLRNKRGIKTHGAIMFAGYSLNIVPALNKVWQSKWRTTAYCAHIAACTVKIIASSSPPKLQV